MCSLINKFSSLFSAGRALVGKVNKFTNFPETVNNGPLWACARLHSQQPETQRMVKTSDTDDEDIRLSAEIISNVNRQLEEGREGRLFAVVQVCGKQFKVTTEDLIIIEGYWAPQQGDRLKLEKVLLVGGSDFTLIGRPILSSDLVSVEVTVIEKALSHIKTIFKKKRRKQYKRINFVRTPLTTLRINSIEIKPEVGIPKDVQGLEGKIF